jgi:hypothetical protein
MELCDSCQPSWAVPVYPSCLAARPIRNMCLPPIRLGASLPCQPSAVKLSLLRNWQHPALCNNVRQHSHTCPPCHPPPKSWSARPLCRSLPGTAMCPQPARPCRLECGACPATNAPLVWTYRCGHAGTGISRLRYQAAFSILFTAPAPPTSQMLRPC